MNVGAVGLAAAIVGATVLVTGARDGRVARIGLVLALTLAPLLATPLPSPAAFAARITGGLLAAVLLGGPVLRAGGSRLGWPAEALFAVGALVVGLSAGIGLAELGGGPDGGAEPEASLLQRLSVATLALGSGCALLVLVLRRLTEGGDPGRAAMALAAGISGIVLVRTGLAGPPGDVEQLAVAALSVAVAAGGAAIARAAARRSDPAVP